MGLCQIHISDKERGIGLCYSLKPLDDIKTVMLLTNTNLLQSHILAVKGVRDFTINRWYGVYHCGL